MRVLVAEDDDRTRRACVELLEGEGYVPLAKARDGHEPWSSTAANTRPSCCSTFMMPHLPATSLPAIRREDASVPILFLSAKSEEFDKVLGLEYGRRRLRGQTLWVRESWRVSAR